MSIVNTKVKFHCSVEDVWNIVTSLTDYAWRSDLSRIEVVSEKKFVEYTNKGYATTFTITLAEPYKRWEFNIENDNIEGHWTGEFSETNGETEISFIEDVKPKKFFVKPFVKGYLKKQQEAYIADLRKVVEEIN